MSPQVSLRKIYGRSTGEDYAVSARPTVQHSSQAAAQLSIAE